MKVVSDLPFMYLPFSFLSEVPVFSPTKHRPTATVFAVPLSANYSC